MKVLMLVNHISTLTFRDELIREMIARNIELIISVPFEDGIDYYESLGCKCVDAQISAHGMNPISEFKLLQYYKRIIKQIKPDIVLSFTIKPNIYGGIACKALKMPCIMNITGLGVAVENSGLVQKLMLFLYKLALPGASTVFFQNSDNEKFFTEHGLAVGKHEMLPGSGVNLSRYAALDYPNDGEINFLFISRVMKEKGADQYFDAAETIRAKYPQTRFHVIGLCEDDAYKTKLSELESRGIIAYHGYQLDTRPFQIISSCTVHPTYYPEGMSNVLLESCASARPIITTDRSGCREIVVDGVNGYVCRQQDSDDLIKTLERFIALSWEQKRDMGLAGRAKVEREFDRQIVIDRYFEQIEKILK